MCFSSKWTNEWEEIIPVSTLQDKKTVFICIILNVFISVVPGITGMKILNRHVIWPARWALPSIAFGCIWIVGMYSSMKWLRDLVRGIPGIWMRIAIDNSHKNSTSLFGTALVVRFLTLILNKILNWMGWEIWSKINKPDDARWENCRCWVTVHREHSIGYQKAMKM